MKIRLLLVLALLGLVPAGAEAQRQRSCDWTGEFSNGLASPDDYWRHPSMNNTPYSGKFTLARIWYSGYFAFCGEGPGWAHDYPSAEENFSSIIKEITLIRLRMDGGNILRADDPELFKYPVAYLSEPGGWFPTNKEAEGLRNYMLKGGLLIMDDWRGPEATINAVAGLKKVFPMLTPLRMDPKYPIFDAFYRIDDPESKLQPVGARNGGGGRGGRGGGGFGGGGGGGGRDPAQFWGVFENNDPTKRLYAMLDVNLDIGEYWQWSGTTRNPINMTNEAFKFGVNYLVYTMTH